MYDIFVDGWARVPTQKKTYDLYRENLVWLEVEHSAKSPFQKLDLGHSSQLEISKKQISKFCNPFRFCLISLFCIINFFRDCTYSFAKQMSILRNQMQVKCKLNVTELVNQLGSSGDEGGVEGQTPCKPTLFGTQSYTVRSYLGNKFTTVAENFFSTNQLINLLPMFPLLALTRPFSFQLDWQPLDPQ